MTGIPDDNTEQCAKCGQTIKIGDWPYCPHGSTLPYHPFTPYFDFALGREITSHAERWTAMRGEIDRDTGERRGRLDYRDKMSPGDLSARRDRVEAQRREERRRS